MESFTPLGFLRCAGTACPNFTDCLVPVILPSPQAKSTLASAQGLARLSTALWAAWGDLPETLLIPTICLLSLGREELSHPLFVCHL